MPDSRVHSADGTGSDLHLELSPEGPRRAAVAAALRAAVRSGRLAPGTRLPPYRTLAIDLGVARNTVADAYAELVAEGWLTARQGSGTRVADRAAPRAHRLPKPAPARAQATHDLRQGQPDATSFPRTAWVTAVRRAVTGAPHDAYGPGDPQGRVELRRVLAEYLARARGVDAAPEQIVVCAGFAHGLRLLFGGGVLTGPLAVEPYSLAFHRAILSEAGVRTLPLRLDAGGARTDELTTLSRGSARPRAVLLTPAHQFPTGGPLIPPRRTAAVDWARHHDGMVLEDDYDGEFRYDREPVGAVQGLDPDHVIYFGSVSKSLSPAIRLGWMILPPHLVESVLAAKGLREPWTGVTDQLALAEFIESGQYDKHVRRMRQRYRARRNLLTTMLAEYAPYVTVTGIAAGLHAVLRLPPDTEKSTVEAADRVGVALDGLAAFRHLDSREPHRDGLVVGYATPPEHRYRPALEALCRALPRAAAQPSASDFDHTGLSK
ncbi:MocR-like pyridoxine biosynthesis transcription factor PdxR [Nocardia vermiculata]|uniref:PLP-dependent aminotransferase family protein n=1 Tax=Nocardia vermiculata TaxID=257274 RepID=A0A846Y2X8_9NOCA|nr:PLP-dependent aminotransferase family protein [Nocardia vermiculata]NKY52575.1 PLP-dependent aminotransferase family protein [Nocardia vermiculata]